MIEITYHVTRQIGHSVFNYDCYDGLTLEEALKLYRSFKDTSKCKLVKCTHTEEVLLSNEMGEKIAD